MKMKKPNKTNQLKNKELFKKNSIFITHFVFILQIKNENLLKSKNSTFT